MWLIPQRSGGPRHRSVNLRKSFEGLSNEVRCVLALIHLGGTSSSF